MKRSLATTLTALAALMLLPALAAWPRLAQAQSADVLKHYEELDRACEAARAKKLAPLRAQKVEACVNDEKRARSECEQEFATYGDTRGLATGRARAGIYYDLPECVAATEARQKYRQ